METVLGSRLIGFLPFTLQVKWNLFRRDTEWREKREKPFLCRERKEIVRLEKDETEEVGEWKTFLFRRRMIEMILSSRLTLVIFDKQIDQFPSISTERTSSSLSPSVSSSDRPRDVARGKRICSEIFDFFSIKMFVECFGIALGRKRVDDLLIVFHWSRSSNDERRNFICVKNGLA